MRQPIVAQSGESLNGYLAKITHNFIELYKTVIASEPAFIGLDATVLASGLIPDARIDSNIARWQDINDLPDLVLLFENKLI